MYRDYIEAKIDADTALQLLNERVGHWTDDKCVAGLFEQMYERYIEDGLFDGCEFDPMVIVDNDYVNYCTVVCEGDDGYEKIAKVFAEQGYGDCSCEDCDGNFIEAYDEAEKAFLIRW